MKIETKCFHCAKINIFILTQNYKFGNKVFSPENSEYFEGNKFLNHILFCEIRNLYSSLLCEYWFLYLLEHLEAPFVDSDLMVFVSCRHKIKRLSQKVYKLRSTVKACCN